MADDATVVEAARTRARRRLLGALVLLVAGVIGFPLLFETRPRPLPVDTPIEIPPRELAAAPAPPAKAPALPELPPPDASAETSPTSTVAATALRSSEAGAAAASPVAATAVPAPAPRASTAASAVTSASPSPRLASPAAPSATPSPPPATPASRPDDGARARALLEGSGAPLKVEARFVVQVGAYSDAAALREARERVEKLGLKTYTQVIDTESGKRTRVRVGPYASREEADAAAAKVKRAGLPANILAL